MSIWRCSTCLLCVFVCVCIFIHDIAFQFVLHYSMNSSGYDVRFAWHVSFALSSIVSDCFIAYICIDVESYVFGIVMHHITVCVHADWLISALDHTWYEWSLRYKNTSAVWNWRQSVIHSLGSCGSSGWFGKSAVSLRSLTTSRNFLKVFSPRNAFRPKCLFWSPLDALEGPWSA